MNLNKKQKTIITIIFVTIFIGYFYISQAMELSNTKKQLLEAEKPSLIEIQKRELEGLEAQWKFKQQKVIELRKNANIIEQEKLRLEPLIREKRNEILGKK